MLVLSRRVGEEIVIDEKVRVRVVAVQGERVRVGVCAPDSVRVDRAEVHSRRMHFESDEPSTSLPVANVHSVGGAKTLLTAPAFPNP